MSVSFEELEKSNCHLHITGALHPENVRQLAHAAMTSVVEFEPLEQALDFDNPIIWAAAKEVTSTKSSLLLAASMVLSAERNHNVSYVELTLNPYGMLRRGMNADEIAEALAEAAAYGESVGVTMGIKYGVNRKDGPESIAAVQEVYQATPDDLRHSIDLNGDEEQFPTLYFIEGFQQLAKKGIPTTVHAGEFMHLEGSLRDAMSMQPTRIAHAVAAQDDKTARELHSRGITVEVAPTSNLIRGASSSLRYHHLQRLLENDVQVVLGTDDPVFFGNSMTSELYALQEMGLTHDQIVELNQSINDRQKPTTNNTSRLLGSIVVDKETQ